MDDFLSHYVVALEYPLVDSFDEDTGLPKKMCFPSPCLVFAKLSHLAQIWFLELAVNPHSSHDFPVSTVCGTNTAIF